ncbi:L-seryl-tRNA(Sec) selenium transferase [Kineococcus rhizosphaerae]|uniref:L-seryl-tRNA(Sec) selenium transferase n=1 Tax=Kineococcus rhizosphaerae TaxID=559628 RepID=A0A2T0RAU1_9ACTN|nr:L-seryl-tRNA(Sec) selenium transferase [Kineococcus rhizosphaerae]PRY18273.1 L-seryl-tRNA(Sec) selenium transferase [Kineococcus rhizosphaerae]
MTDHRRTVPRTDALLADPRLAPAVDSRGRDVVKTAVRQAQQAVREGSLPVDGLVEAVLAALPPAGTSLRPVLNATGAILHTNLGRAQLSAAAVEAVVTASGATDVELDLVTGRRARRGRGTLAALREAVPAAGDVHVVNNGAAALVLVATALAAGREIVVSRGELVEIGDGFRLPDLLESTGARLREVGTTNRTSLADYRDAVGPDTGFVLKVHPSNFVVSGFTAGVDPGDLTGLGVPVVVDIGSGLLAPDPLLPDEPDATTTLRAGADLVTASGDKLLGGPQAGLLLGEAGLVERLRRHVLARALRVDKLTLAALEATLRSAGNPTRDAVHADVDVLRTRCSAVAEALRRNGFDARAEESVAVVGGGGAPGVDLPSWVVSLPADLAVPLRTGPTPVAGRVEDGRLLLDLRTVPVASDGTVVDAVVGLR